MLLTGVEIEQEEKNTVEFVVNKQTKATAETFGLHDRGEIKEGLLADINIIDYDNLKVFKPEMVHDLPTGSKKDYPEIIWL